jgi:hypothetical protein
MAGRGQPARPWAGHAHGAASKMEPSIYHPGASDAWLWSPPTHLYSTEDANSTRPTTPPPTRPGSSEPIEITRGGASTGRPWTCRGHVCPPHGPSSIPATMLQRWRVGGRGAGGASTDAGGASVREYGRGSATPHADARPPEHRQFNAPEMAKLCMEGGPTNPAKPPPAHDRAEAEFD